MRGVSKRLYLMSQSVLKKTDSMMGTTEESRGDDEAYGRAWAQASYGTTHLPLEYDEDTRWGSSPSRSQSVIDQLFKRL
jgi:hypothetical protein